MGLHVKPGEVWICKSAFNIDVQSTDVFAKVMKVFPDTGNVFVIRRTNFGFEDLPPKKFSLDEFLSMYQFYGRCEK